MDCSVAKALLGVEDDAPDAVIKAAYQRVAMVVHPDRVQGTRPDAVETAARLMALATAARDTLTGRTSAGDSPRTAVLVEEALNVALSSLFQQASLAPAAVPRALQVIMDHLSSERSSGDLEADVLHAREALIKAALTASIDELDDLENVGRTVHFAVVLLDAGLSIKALAQRSGEFDVTGFVEQQRRDRNVRLAKRAKQERDARRDEETRREAANRAAAEAAAEERLRAARVRAEAYEAAMGVEEARETRAHHGAPRGVAERLRRLDETLLGPPRWRRR